MNADDWHEVSPFELGGVLVFIAVVLGFALLSEDRWVPILDSANLAFHEAGHPLFGIFGPTLGLYGGTIAQLAFPFATALAFLRQRRAHGVAACGAWLGENLLNVGRYVSDARAQELPLAGGGEHDWWHILTRWGLLEHDTTLGTFTRVLGAAVMLGCAAALIGLRRAQQR